MHALAARVLPLLLLSLAGFSSAACAQDPRRIEDPDYCFRIESPGREWTLLAEAEARALASDAIAGLSNGGTIFMVLVEAAPSVTIDAYADLIRGQTALKDAEISPPESLTYRGMQARRWTATGKFNGAPTRTQTLVFLREGFAYQLAGICPGASKDGKRSVDLSVLEQHFFLTPGTVRARKPAAMANSIGPGWRVVDGVYQNAVNGLEIRAPESWRFAVGDELFSMNEYACVGLVCTEPEAYMVWIIAPTGGANEADYVASERLVFSAEAKVGESIKMSGAGLEFPMTPTHVAGATPLVFLQGIQVRDGLAIQVRAWCMAGLEDRAFPQIERALKAARFLEPAQRASLAAELREKRDPQNVVGDDYCLRGGVYRNFGQRFKWTKPAGFWRVDTGDQAREQNKLATIYIHAPEWGIKGVVVIETDVESEPRAYHDSIVPSGETFEPLGAPQELKLGETPALMSVVRSKIDALERTHFAVSAVHEKRAYQIMLWCLSGNLDAARPAIDAAIQGLRITGREPKTEISDTRFVDHRLGFQLRKPDGKGWDFRNATLPQSKATSSMVVYTSAAAEILGAGVCAIGEQQDSTMLRKFVIDAIRKDAGVESDARSSVTAPAMLAGLAAERLELPGKRTTIMYITQRDSTAYYITVETDGKAGSPTEEELVKLFELVD